MNGEPGLKHIWYPCSQMKDYEATPPIIIENGEGIYLYDNQGKKYADLISSWWCNLLGHCNSRINDAVKRQIDKLEHVIFAGFSHEQAINLCEKLTKVLPQNITKFHFTDNGSSAVEAAMKMSFQYFAQNGKPEKQRFMALKGGYHGETLGVLSACGLDAYSAIYKPILMDVIFLNAPDCYRCKHGLSRDNCNGECFEANGELFCKYGKSTCALLVEPLLQGAAGMKIYPKAFLRKLKQACVDYNIHFIADEIATGFARTGDMFACIGAGVEPDIICLSKGLTGGYMPMAIVGATQDIFDGFYGDYSENKGFLHSHTYSGNPLACAAANEVLNIFAEDDILQKSREKSIYFKKLLADAFASHKNVGEIRSIGLINAIEIVENKQDKTSFDPKLRYGNQIFKKGLEKGLILRPLGDVIYFNPPLTIEEDELKSTTRLARECLEEVLG